MAEQPDGKTRRRTSGKAAIRKDGGKVKTTISLSADASRRLAVHAAMTDADKSEVVEQLIQTHLRRYVVSDRAGIGAGDSEGDQA